MTGKVSKKFRFVSAALALVLCCAALMTAPASAKADTGAPPLPGEYGNPTQKTDSVTTKYLIRVDTGRQVVNVWKSNDGERYTQLVRSFVCSSGAYDRTPLGEYTITEKYRWKILNGNVWGQYCCRFREGYLFHSVPYSSSYTNALITHYYNQLGSQASAGCVRMRVADVKWMYDNCPIGTRVHIYKNERWPGEPNKIIVGRVPEGSGWDPTDPDPANPNFSSAEPQYVYSTTSSSETDGTYSEGGSNFTVKAPYLCMHAGKDKTSEVLSVLKKGDQVYGYATGDGWVMIVNGDVTGWVRDGYFE